MSSVPTVSVVIPVYNTERYIVDTVNSILNQTFSDFELIILDDGSKDRSPDLLRELAAKDSRIRLIIRENRGIVRTRNELLENCRGKYMAVNDADDLSQPDRPCTDDQNISTKHFTISACSLSHKRRHCSPAPSRRSTSGICHPAASRPWSNRSPEWDSRSR